MDPSTARWSRPRTPSRSIGGRRTCSSISPSASASGRAVAAFSTAAGLDAKGFQRAFLVGGGPDHVVGIDTAGDLAAPIFELPKAIAGLRRIDPEAQAKLVDFLVDHREVMSYTP